MNFMSLSILLESWPDPVLIVSFFVLLGAVAGVVGGVLAFVRARERLWQRLVLGALAGALTSWVVFSSRPGPEDTIGTHVFWCVIGGYAGADGISVLLKAIRRIKNRYVSL